MRDVDNFVGPRQRSSFVTRAITEQLKRERLRKALDAVMDLPTEGNGPEEWNTPESTVQWVRDLRAESDRLREERFRRNP